MAAAAQEKTPELKDRKEKNKKEEGMKSWKDEDVDANKSNARNTRTQKTMGEDELTDQNVWLSDRLVITRLKIRPLG